jgi:ATP-dependent RNA helicase DDX42
MSKRKFGFGGFGINKKASYEFEAVPSKPRLYLPSPPRGTRPDSLDDHDLQNIRYADSKRDSDPWDSKGDSVAVERRSSNHGTDKDYESESDEEDGNPGAAAAADQGDDDEIDPLDAFMEGIHEEVCVNC